MLKLWAIILLIIAVQASHSRKPVYTQVTFLYDIKRGNLKSYRRSFQYYLGFFQQLLRTESNLIVFGDKKMEDYVWKRRQQHNTVFVHKELQQFKSAWYSNLTEKTRQQFLRDFGEEREEPQFTLQYYCLIVFGKLEVMKQAIKYDRWNTDFLIWTDGGILHAFDKAQPYHNFVTKFYQSFQPQWAYTNIQTQETYNYKTFKEGQAKYIGRKMLGHEQVWAGVMGGDIHTVTDILNAFDIILRLTLQNGDMFSEQSVLALIPIKYPLLIPISSTTRMDKIYNQLEVYGQVRKDYQMKPRYFHANIDLKGKAFITSQTERAYQQNANKAIGSFIQAIQKGIQYQESLIGPFSSFKKHKDRLIIWRKAIFVGSLWILLIIILYNNGKMKKELSLNSQRIETL